MTQPASPMFQGGPSNPVPEGRRIPIRSNDDVLVGMAQLLEEQLAELKHIRACLGSSSDSRSSVEVKTSTRGVDIASKAYEGSSTDGLVDLAVDNYFATLEKVQARANAPAVP